MEQRITFEHLDQDTEPRLMRPGASRYMLNCRVGSSLNGNEGAIETLKGNRLLSFALPAGDNKTVGSCEDSEGGRCFYLLCNSLGAHAVMMYDVRGNVLSKVFEWAGLGFDPNRPVTGTAFLDGTLFWTDNLNPIRKINIAKALEGMYEACKANGEKNFLNVLLPAPMEPPLVDARAKDAFRHNYIYDKSFQFCYRYRYFDGSLSVLSPFSKLSPMSRRRGPTNALLPVSGLPNRIDVTLPVSRASRLVDSIDVFFREGNSGKWRLFKTIEKEKIAGVFNYVIFYNDSASFPVDEAYAAKAHESVPNTALALCAADNRLMVGNYREGYERATVSMALSLPETPFVPSTPNSAVHRALKSESVYRVGVVFKDYANRSSGVCRGADSVATRPMPQFVTGFPNYFQPHIAWELNGAGPAEIPDWATHYQIVRTRSQSVSSFFQGVSADVAYAAPAKDAFTDPATAAPTGFRYGRSFTSRLFTYRMVLVDISSVLGSGIGYVFSEGDRIRIGTPNASLNVDVPIIGQYGKFVATEVADLGTLPAGGNACYVFEIYTPYRAAQEEVFYEVGESFPVSNPGTGLRDYTARTGTVGGDVWLVSRKWDKYLSEKYDINRPDNEIDPKNYSVYVESSSTDDPYFYRWDTDIGRITAELKNAGTVHKDNHIRFSNRYVEGTQINGFSEFEALNEYVLPVEGGPVAKLQPVGKNLLSLQHDRVVSIYVGQSEITDTRGQVLISVSESVLGSNNPLKGAVGCQHPETVQERGGSVYWFDMNRGAVLCYTDNGVSAISERLMSSYFTRRALEYRAAPYSLRACFDRLADEYVLTLGGETLGFRESVYDERRRWVSFYSFAPEWYASAGERMLSFTAGACHLHESDEVPRNRFYGVQFKSVAVGNVNAAPNRVKVLQRLRLESDEPWEAPAVTAPNGQETELRSADFETYEFEHYAEFMRDKNTPHVAFPLFEGDEMRAAQFSVRLEYTGGNRGKLLAANVGFFLSNTH